ncbi:MAG: hypothetical protein AABX51_07725, partial [Nanoarchaeota archaeon]
MSLPKEKAEYYDSQIKKINEKLNQALRIRYELVQRKIKIWEVFDYYAENPGKIPSNEKSAFESIIRDLNNCIKKELTLIKIIEPGLNATLAILEEIINEFKKTKEKKLSNLLNQVNLFSEIFKKFKKHINKYKGSIEKENKLLSKVNAEKFSDFKHAVELRITFLEEIFSELNQLEDLKKSTPEIENINKDLKFINTRKLIGAGALATIPSSTYMYLSVGSEIRGGGSLNFEVNHFLIALGIGAIFAF